MKLLSLKTLGPLFFFNYGDIFDFDKIAFVPILYNILVVNF